MATRKAASKKEDAPKGRSIKVEFSADEKSNPVLKAGRVEAYEVDEKELDFVHVELEKVEFERGTGKKKSKPFVQKFDPRAWNNFRGEAKKLGFTHVRVLYAPEGTNLEVLDPSKAERRMGKK